jgi:hypothetical protein
VEPQLNCECFRYQPIGKPYGLDTVIPAVQRIVQKTARVSANLGTKVALRAAALIVKRSADLDGSGGARAGGGRADAAPGTP